MIRRILKNVLIRSLRRRAWRVERRVKRLSLRLELIKWRLDRLDVE